MNVMLSFVRKLDIAIELAGDAGIHSSSLRGINMKIIPQGNVKGKSDSRLGRVSPRSGRPDRLACTSWLEGGKNYDVSGNSF